MFQSWDLVKNSVLNTLPFASKTLPPVRNIFGEPVNYAPGIGAGIASVFFTNDKKQEDSKLYAELRRLGSHSPLLRPEPLPGETELQLRMPSRVFPIRVGGKRTGIKLDSEQYSRLVELSAGKMDSLEEDFDQFNGMTLKQALSEMVGSGYDQLGLPEEDITDEMKRISLKGLVSAYQRAGRLLFKATDNSVQERLREEAVKRGGAFNIDIDTEDLDPDIEKAQRLN